MIKATATFTPKGLLGRFIPAIITPAVTASVQAAVDQIKDTAKLYCPVDTGALSDSITAEVNETGSTVRGTVGPHMYYADYVEYGTGRRGDPTAPYPHVESWPGMHAQAYMRPALDENKGSILDLFRGNISSAINNG